MTGHHHHHHGADFDWQAMADSLEVDGAMVLPLVEKVCDQLEAKGLDTARVRHVVDIGCGPGVVTCALAALFPAARVTGLDSSPELLSRLRSRAVDAGVGERIDAVTADIEHDLPELEGADIVWASMVVHHVTDPTATVTRLGGLLRSGGTLVLVEFGGAPRILPDDDPIVAGGTWSRLETAARASLARRLGPNVIDRDWPRDLGVAGLEEITDARIEFSYEPPLDDLRRRWLSRHIHRGSGMAREALDRSDVDALDELAAAVEDGTRRDAFVAAERRVLTARRP